MNTLSRKKIWNYRLIEYQKKKGWPVVFGYPYWLTIDPSNICNLRCVFCPTGQMRHSRQQTMLTFDRFKKIIDTIGPYLLHIDFCNWGEPLLNRDLPKMAAYAKRYGPTMKFDSNLNIDLTEEDAEAILTSGITQFNMSVDGASQETYGVYRKGGDFKKVLENMRLLVRKKKELGLTRPKLHWQFLVFKHNEHELIKARALSYVIGVDTIGFTAPFCAPEWVSTKDEFNNYLVKDDRQVAFKKKNEICNWLWDAITINANGSVSPCCSVEDEKDDFDNFFSKPFWMLWNSAEYRKARRFVARGRKEGSDNVCTRCDHIGASNHASITL